MGLDATTPLDHVIVGIVFGDLDEHLNEIQNIVEARLKTIKEAS